MSQDKKTITVETVMDSKYNSDEIRIKDTNNNWYGANKAEYSSKFKSGWEVLILCEKVGEKTVLIRNAKVLKEGEPINKGRRGGGGGRPQDPNAVPRMTLSKAREEAVAQALFEAGAGMIYTDGAKKTDKQKQLQVRIDVLTAMYYNQTMNAQKWVEGMNGQKTESADPDFADTPAEPASDPDFDTEPAADPDFSSDPDPDFD